MKKVSMFAAIGLAVAILLLGVWGCNISGDSGTTSTSQGGAKAYAPGSSQQTGLWVNGQGSVSAAPDVIILQLGVESQEATVAQAQSKARDAMNKVKDVLTAKGVADKDIRTAQFSIQPVTRYIEKENRQQIIGYRVSNQVNVKVRKIDQAGPIIDAVSEAGGDLTRIQSISFTIDDTTPLLTQAREKAMKDAQAKAEQLAKLGKITLGKPIYISESGFLPPTPSPIRLAAGAAAEAALTPISPGEQEIRVTVQVVYAIQ